MAITQFHSLLLAKIENEINSRAGSIASGACTDYPHYRQEVGYIKGLTAALALADEVEKENA